MAIETNLITIILFGSSFLKKIILLLFSYFESRGLIYIFEEKKLSILIKRRVSDKNAKYEKKVVL